MSVSVKFLTVTLFIEKFTSINFSTVTSLIGNINDSSNQLENISNFISYILSVNVYIFIYISIFFFILLYNFINLILSLHSFFLFAILKYKITNTTPNGYKTRILLNFVKLHIIFILFCLLISLLVIYNSLIDFLIIPSNPVPGICPEPITDKVLGEHILIIITAYGVPWLILQSFKWLYGLYGGPVFFKRVEGTRNVFHIISLCAPVTWLLLLADPTKTGQYNCINEERYSAWWCYLWYNNMVRYIIHLQVDWLIHVDYIHMHFSNEMYYCMFIYFNPYTIEHCGGGISVRHPLIAENFRGYNLYQLFVKVYPDRKTADDLYFENRDLELLENSLSENEDSDENN